MDTRILGDENRRDKRYLVWKLEVFAKESNELIGNVINLSQGGMLMAHSDAIAVGSKFKIKVAAGNASDGPSGFTAKVQVKWFRKNEISGIFGSGLEFLKSTKKQRAKIQEMINAYAVIGD